MEEDEMVMEPYYPKGGGGTVGKEGGEKRDDLFTLILIVI